MALKSSQPTLLFIIKGIINYLLLVCAAIILSNLGGLSLVVIAILLISFLAKNLG
jgi:hypothetical protein